MRNTNTKLIDTFIVKKRWQPKPWGDCDPNPKELKYYEHYTRAACLIECQNTIYLGKHKDLNV